MHSVSHNSHTIGQPTANKLYDGKAEVKPEGCSNIA
jgi:hypothetical protein